MMEFKTKSFIVESLGDQPEIDTWLNSLLKGGFSAAISGYVQTVTGNPGRYRITITAKRWRKESQPAPVSGSQIGDAEETTIE